MMAPMPTLEILHWNDVHGHWAELSRLSARAREIRAAADHPVLLLDGGDIEDNGARLSSLTKGVAGWRLLGAAGVDAAVVGNGGLLRYGPGVLPSYAEALHSPPLVCDLELDGLSPAGIVRSRLLTAGGLKVGIIGATDYYPQYDDFGLSERGRVTAVRGEANLLRRQGADIVIVLSHCGLHGDMALSWSLRGVADLIVGGHSHDVAEGAEPDQGVPIVQADCWGRRLGRVTLEVAAGGVWITDVRQEVNSDDWPADPAVLSELEACERDLAAWLDEPVGRLDQPVSWHPHYDSSVARLMIEALLDAYPAEVGLLIAGHCEGGLPAGKVTRGDIWSATSSPGNAATATVTGADLRAIARRGTTSEYAVREARAFRGRQYGTLHLVGAELRDGELFIAGRPVEDSRAYRVTGSDMELSTYGGMVDSEPVDLRIHTPVILPELLEAYLSSRM